MSGPRAGVGRVVAHVGEHHGGDVGTPVVVRVALAGTLGDDSPRASPEGDAMPVTVADADHPLGAVDRLDVHRLVFRSLPARRVADPVGEVEVGVAADAVGAHAGRPVVTHPVVRSMPSPKT
ncbi:hypothetical protein ACFQL0_08290 [Haloplanus litoreus]|uniref:PemK-like, MazF-like toxin of type II toxin-antitoxin system n=1 Tax=Haloplanus litoreus TaxID=767515 RepID=A0ABD6A1L5_9EURY